MAAALQIVGYPRRVNVSFSVAVRLKTMRAALESGSTQK
jgi:hypothetical protein